MKTTSKMQAELTNVMDLVVSQLRIYACSISQKQRTNTHIKIIFGSNQRNVFLEEKLFFFFVFFLVEVELREAFCSAFHWTKRVLQENVCFAFRLDTKKVELFYLRRNEPKMKHGQTCAFNLSDENWVIFIG